MKTPQQISYSDGSVVRSPVIQIWDDLHAERRGNWFRAFWCSSPDASLGSPVIGYCSSGGSRRTVKAAAHEVWELYPDALVFRNRRQVKGG